MHVFKHPKYYEEMRQRAKRYQKELRERNKSDQDISTSDSTECSDKRAPGPGQTNKQQASSSEEPSENHRSSKPQAPSDKPQAPSDSKTLEQES